MADDATSSTGPIVFDTEPERYRHWRLAFDGPVATLTMQVDPGGGLRSDYELKLNSYDLGVDIELYDAVQRLRFEHPEIGSVVITGGIDKVFCAGANIQMLAGATHGHKVNFCKFTNETRSSIEDATARSGQTYLAAVNGTAAGGGYELALACDEIILVDDRASTVSLPEVPLLAVLPGTGGLTRVVDKRHVRHDLADVFCTRAEGVKGEQAVAWGLVDTIAPRSTFDTVVRERAVARATASDRPIASAGSTVVDVGGTVVGVGGTVVGVGVGVGVDNTVVTAATGMALTPIERSTDGEITRYAHLTVALDRALGAAHLTVHGPTTTQPQTPDELAAAGADAWVMAAARQLDHAVLHLRLNEPELGSFVLRTAGDAGAVLAADELLSVHADNWLVREVSLHWTRTLKRLDLSARTLVALVEPGSCFAGVLAELALAADRTYMLDGERTDGDGRDVPAATLRLTVANDGRHPMANGISRLATRFYGCDADLATARSVIGKDLIGADALAAGLVTFAPDDIDFDDEVRVVLEERHSFSPDALTGLEANLRFAGPETMETKIFARLTAWQNWIFQRPNAVGPDGALRRYGTGSRPTYDRARV